MIDLKTSIITIAYRTIGVFILTILLSNCAIKTINNTLSPTQLLAKPISKVVSHPRQSLAQYSRFTILPLTPLYNTHSAVQPSMALLYTLRNQLENRGYQYSDQWQTSELIILAEGSCSGSHELLSPELSNQILTWKIAEHIDQYSSTNSEEALKSILKTALWGSYPETADTISCTNNDDSGNSIRYYYPQISIAIADRSSMRLLWLGASAGISTQANYAVSNQLLASALSRQIPISKLHARILPRQSGQIGISFSIISTDGVHYYPTITHIQHHSAADKAGLKINDFIADINEQSTRNLNSSAVVQLLSGLAGSKVNFTILRNGHYKEVSLRR